MVTSFYPSLLAAGKTTVATIYGAVLRDLGLLSKGDVLVKVPADFIGDVLGASEKKTMAILEEARGRVLVIDEAYGLHSGNRSRDPYKVCAVPPPPPLTGGGGESAWVRVTATQPSM